MDCLLKKGVIERSGYILPDQKSQSYHRRLGTYHRFKMIGSSGKSFLSSIYLHWINVVPKPTFNGKIETCVRKITAVAIGACQWACKKDCLINSNLRSAWLTLLLQKHSWFTIDWVYWKTFTKTKNSKVICNW